MRKNMNVTKGFTLIELLAVLIVMAVITLIASPKIVDIINNAKSNAFKNSVLRVFEAYDVYDAENYFEVEERVDVTNRDFPLNSNFISGTVYRRKNGEVRIEKVTDGKYCATGTIYNLSVVKGDCELLGEIEEKVEIEIEVVKITGKTIAVKVVQTKGETDIEKYYYSIGTPENYKKGTETYTYSNLEPNKTYKVYVKVETPELVEITAMREITTKAVSLPTYEVSEKGWTNKDKKVIITYPNIEGNINEYSIDRGTTWIKATSNEQEVTFKENGSVIARIRNEDGIETADPLTVDKIDKNAPTITNISGNTSEWTKDKTITVEAEDNESGVKEYSFDNGVTWQTSNSKSITSNGTYKIKVKDNAGNISEETTNTIIEIGTIDSTTPLVSIIANKSSAGTQVLSNTWSNETLKYTITNETTTGSRVTLKYCVDTTNTCTPSIAASSGIAFNVNNTGTYYVRYQAVSESGLNSNIDTFIGKVDVTTPVLNMYAMKQTEGTQVSSNTWSNEKLKYIISKEQEGESGITIKYCVDTANTCTPNITVNSDTEFNVNNTGTYYVRYQGTSGSQVKTTLGSYTGKIDIAGPTITAVTTAGKTITITASDNTGGSGIKEYSFDNGSTWQTSNIKTVTSGGQYKVKVKDNAGNISEVSTATVTSDANDKKNGTGVSTYTEETKHEMFYFSHPSTGQLEAIGDYRYIGDDPYNYVTFNGEEWRIIGLFTVEDGSGKKEQRYKIIKNGSIGTENWNNKYQVTSSGSGLVYAHDWSKASLNTYLNDTWYYYLSYEAQQMIGDAKYYLGGAYSDTKSGPDYYKAERSKTIVGGMSTASWVGKIGLIYPSDILYVAANGVNQSCFTGTSMSCSSKNWINSIQSGAANGHAYMTIITPNAYYWNEVISYDLETEQFVMCNGGSYCYGSHVNDSSMFDYPVIYLKSDVKMISGTGQRSDPYILSR